VYPVELGFIGTCLDGKDYQYKIKKVDNTRWQVYKNGGVVYMAIDAETCILWLNTSELSVYF
jgi:hypothetical protein